MNKVVKRVFQLLCVAVVLLSCERKALFDDCVCSSTLTLPINIDWATSGILPQNVTILFYDSEDGALAYEHIFEHNGENIQSYVQLSEGSYTAVVFNELLGQIDNVLCVDHHFFSTLKFEGHDDNPLRSRSESRKYIKQSGDLAVAVVENIVITQDMILEANTSKSPVDMLMGVVPKKRNTVINIIAHIDNIYYARMPALVDLVNLSDGYFVEEDKNSGEPSTIQFTMNNRAYDQGSIYNGKISTSITTFGTLHDRGSTQGYSEKEPIILDILFKQIDESQSEVSLEMDVTSQVIHTKLSDGSMLITIDVRFDEELPAVKPEDSSGDSGFGAQTEDWEDVDVPLQQ